MNTTHPPSTPAAPGAETPLTDSHLDEMANAFLRWPLPESVCADLCSTKQQPGRVGTNLLSYTEAKAMIRAVAEPTLRVIINEETDAVLLSMLSRLRRDLAARDSELAAERNLHGQTRVVVEELNIICNDLRNAGQPQFIRSEAIRLLREDQAELRSKLQTATERAERAERERDGLKTSGMDADTCIEIEELKKFKARLEWLGNPANKFAYSIEKDGEVKVGTRWDFQRFKTLSAAIDHFRGINSAHAASADGHARKEEAP